MDSLQRIYQQVARCLHNVDGGNGSPAAYYLDEETFQVFHQREVGKGLTEYRFDAQGAYIADGDDDMVSSPSEPLSGSIVLDSQMDLTFDEDGSVRLEPWRCVNPLVWMRQSQINAAGDRDSAL